VHALRCVAVPHDPEAVCAICDHADEPLPAAAEWLSHTLSARWPCLANIRGAAAAGPRRQLLGMTQQNFS
jgi:hypothetical protein